LISGRDVQELESFGDLLLLHGALEVCEQPCPSPLLAQELPLPPRAGGVGEEELPALLAGAASRALPVGYQIILAGLELLILLVALVRGIPLLFPQPP
jgi:hypothetical protein